MQLLRGARNSEVHEERGPPQDSRDAPSAVIADDANREPGARHERGEEVVAKGHGLAPPVRGVDDDPSDAVGGDAVQADELRGAARAGDHVDRSAREKTLHGPTAPAAAAAAHETEVACEPDGAVAERVGFDEPQISRYPGASQVVALLGRQWHLVQREAALLVPRVPTDPRVPDRSLDPPRSLRAG